MVDGVLLESEDDVFARIIQEGSRRNCRDAKRACPPAGLSERRVGGCSRSRRE